LHQPVNGFVVRRLVLTWHQSYVAFDARINVTVDNLGAARDCTSATAVEERAGGYPQG